MREGWEYKKLGEVCEVVSGSTPKTNVPEYWGEGHYWVTPAELNDTIVYIDKTERQITDEALTKTKLRLLPVGAVLLSSRAPIGKVAITKTEMYCNQGFKNCICSDSIYNKYLFYFLRLKKEYLNSLGRGATFKEISKSIVESITIPLPPKSAQLAIVSELDKINELIRLKKEQLKDYDNLAQSIFYDMFGDPVENEKGWEVKKLGEVCSQITDGTHNSPTNTKNGDFKYVTAKNIKKEGIVLDNITYVDADTHHSIYSRCNPEYGDILYIKDGATTGIATINNLNEEFSLLSSVALLKLEDKIINYYLKAVLNTPSLYNCIRTNMGGAAITRLTLVKIKAIKIPLPPLPLQHLFAQRIEQIERQKSAVQKSITDLKTLLASRMQYWFE